MNYTGIVKEDFANGEDIGVALFVSGCDLGCNKGECHGQDYYSFDCGTPFNEEAKNEIYKLFEENSYYGRLTITGGNPTSGDNPKALIPFVEEFKKKFPHIKIWLYSGHTCMEILKLDNGSKELMELCDVLVDGRWIPEMYSIKLRYRGSSNQQIIDIKKTTENKNIIIIDELM